MADDRLGQFSDARDRIRTRIEREPVEPEDLRCRSRDFHLPGDFDIAQINWRPDYDAFFYRQLSRRARRLYLFRDEYIFELERAAGGETVTRHPFLPIDGVRLPTDLRTRI